MLDMPIDSNRCFSSLQCSMKYIHECHQCHTNAPGLNTPVSIAHEYGLLVFEEMSYRAAAYAGSQISHNSHTMVCFALYRQLAIYRCNSKSVSNPLISSVDFEIRRKILNKWEFGECSTFKHKQTILKHLCDGYCIPCALSHKAIALLQNVYPVLSGLWPRLIHTQKSAIKGPTVAL